MIYREQLKVPSIHFCNDDYKNQIDAIDEDNTIIVTDPPFNIGYHYNEYKDSMNDAEYYSMLAELVERFPSVIIHYPEALHRLSYESGIMPQRIRPMMRSDAAGFEGQKVGRSPTSSSSSASRR